MNFKPLRKKVLVAQNKQDSTVTESGIIVTGKNAINTITGKVLAVGEEVTEVAVDDTIFLEWNQGRVTTVDNVQCVVIDESNIVAVLEK